MAEKLELQPPAKSNILWPHPIVNHPEMADRFSFEMLSESEEEESSSSVTHKDSSQSIGTTGSSTSTCSSGCASSVECELPCAPSPCRELNAIASTAGPSNRASLLSNASNVSHASFASYTTVRETPEEIASMGSSPASQTAHSATARAVYTAERDFRCAPAGRLPAQLSDLPTPAFHAAGAQPSPNPLQPDHRGQQNSPNAPTIVSLPKTSFDNTNSSEYRSVAKDLPSDILYPQAMNSTLTESHSLATAYPLLPEPHPAATKTARKHSSSKSSEQNVRSISLSSSANSSSTSLSSSKKTEWDSSWTSSLDSKSKTNTMTTEASATIVIKDKPQEIQSFSFEPEGDDAHSLSTEVGASKTPAASPEPVGLSEAMNKVSLQSTPVAAATETAQSAPAQSQPVASTATEDALPPPSTKAPSALTSPSSSSLRLAPVTSRARIPSIEEQLRRSSEVEANGKVPASPTHAAAPLSKTPSHTLPPTVIPAPPRPGAIARSSTSHAFSTASSIHKAASLNRRRSAPVPTEEVHPESQDVQRWRDSIQRQREAKRKRKEFLEDERVLVGTKVSEGHGNFVMAYDMLTGIRVSVSRCNAQVDRELRDSDFTARHKLAFDINGNELTPSAKYDFKFKDYSPWVFRHLRALFKLDPADYLMSLTSKYIVSELGSPGKSGSFFYFSRDYRFIIKTIHHSEHRMLRHILKDYYNHVKNNPNTLISQFYGLHRVKLPFGRKIHFIVMNNLFPAHRDVHFTYDLKGSTLGREFVISPNKMGNVVLKDVNWIHNNERLYLGPTKAAAFMNQLKKDVALLERLNVMDYSLLAGIHDGRRGNSDNIRNSLLSVVEPEVTAPDLRTAVNSAAPVAWKEVDFESASSPNNGRPLQSIFYSEYGGMGAADGNDHALPFIYYFGVIDCLTPYTFKKRVETWFKALNHPRNTISALPAVEYGERFLKFIKTNVVTSKNVNELSAPRASAAHYLLGEEGKDNRRTSPVKDDQVGPTSTTGIGSRNGALANTEGVSATAAGSPEHHLPVVAEASSESNSSAGDRSENRDELV